MSPRRHSSGMLLSPRNSENATDKAASVGNAMVTEMKSEALKEDEEVEEDNENNGDEVSG